MKFNLETLTFGSAADKISSKRLPVLSWIQDLALARHGMISWNESDLTFVLSHKNMNIDKKQIYWIIITVLLTTFGAFELYQLFDTFINDSIATKSSTLVIDSLLLGESLGITLCHERRPNLTYLKERNISENIFNYALSFYLVSFSDLRNLMIVGDPNLLREELASILGENITAKSLKQFLHITSVQPETPIADGDEVEWLSVKDVALQGPTICYQYALKYKSLYQLYFLEQGIVMMKLREMFFESTSNTSSVYFSIYHYDSKIHPKFSSDFLPLSFRKGIHYVSKIDVQIWKHVRKFGCMQAPSRLIPPIGYAKTICLQQCVDVQINCSEISAYHDDKSDLAPPCSLYDVESCNNCAKTIFEAQLISARQCFLDGRCNQTHYCVEWAFNMNALKLNVPFTETYGNGSDVKNEDEFSFHQLHVKFSANSYQNAEVLMMTVDTLLSNVGGLLGLLCGFTITTAAAFIWNYVGWLTKSLYRGRCKSRYSQN